MSRGRLMDSKDGRGLLVAGGLSGILWPVLALSFYVAYPIAAGRAMLAEAGGFGPYASRLAELGQRPAIVLLE
mgnify:CR=1 FL=1